VKLHVNYRDPDPELKSRLKGNSGFEWSGIGSQKLGLKGIQFFEEIGIGSLKVGVKGI
jgi:hypothetical protein